MLKPGIPRPSALQIIPDMKTQPAQPFGLQFDQIAILKRVKSAVIGSGRQNVAGLERMD